jgi:hypothetical protein
MYYRSAQVCRIVLLMLLTAEHTKFRNGSSLFSRTKFLQKTVKLKLYKRGDMELGKHSIAVCSFIDGNMPERKPHAPLRLTNAWFVIGSCSSCRLLL